MARPPNPDTLVALRQRMARLERMTDSHARSPSVTFLRLAQLIAELDALLGLTPGTLNRRINESLAQDDEP